MAKVATLTSPLEGTPKDQALHYWRMGGSMGQQSIEYYHRCGDALERVKESMPHGDYGKWLEENGIPGRTERNLRRAAREYTLEEIKQYDFISHALKALKIEDQTEPVQITQEPEPQAKPHISQATGDNEWYTPPQIIEAVRKVMGSIGLDPASNSSHPG